MKAWIGSGAGDEVSFRLDELPIPTPGPGELLVRARAAGINRVDQFPTGSHFRHSAPAPAPIPGLEAAGEVIEVGPDVAGYQGGERVAAMVQGGCAEYVRVQCSACDPGAAGHDVGNGSGIASVVSDRAQCTDRTWPAASGGTRSDTCRDVRRWACRLAAGIAASRCAHRRIVLVCRKARATFRARTASRSGGSL